MPDDRMQAQLLPDHVAAFRRDGYAVLRGLFGAREVAVMAAAFDRHQAEGLRLGRSWRHGNLLYRLGDDPRLGRIVRLVQWPSYVDPGLDDVRRDRRFAELLRPLIGDDLKQIINQLHWKPPGAAAEFGWHQDIRFRRPRAAYRDPAATYVQTGLAIDPQGPENGALRVIPGSHRLGELVLGDGRPVLERPLGDTDLVAAGLDPAGAVDLVLEPGDVALWHLFLVHGSGPNRSGGDRRFYLNGYVAAAACDRGVPTFQDGRPLPLGPPVLIHYDDLLARPEPHYVEG